MKILSLGLDRSVLDGKSALASRIVEYQQLVDKYFIIVPSDQGQNVKLSDKVEVFGLGGVNKLFQLLNIYRFSIKLINRKKINIITVQDQYYLAFVGYLLKKKFNIGLEIQIHGFEKFKGIRKIIAKYVLKRANAIRVVSQRLKKQLIDDFRVKEDKITVVPIYVNVGVAETQDFASVRDGNKKFIFLTISRLVPVKNIEMQIKAIANLKYRFKNIELWIVGGGPEKRNYESLIKKYELEDKVRLVGYQKDLNEFYQQADVFLLTSNSEGYGMVVIEAASYGLPIIMTDVGCAGEFIKNNENGIIIPTKDEKVLENQMVELIENQELRIKLGNNARDSIKNLLSKEETLNLYKQSWQKAIKK